MFVKNGTGVLKEVLVSRPSYLKPAPINEIAKKWENTTMNIEKMEAEHRIFTEAYARAGVTVEYLDADEERPNAVFARDFGGCVREGYILGNFKLPLRYKEHTDYEKRMEELGVPVIARVKEGLFEGGDFAFLNERTIAIGMADRTNERGVEEIRSQLAEYGYQVIGVSLPARYLHFDMCFNLVDDHLAVAYEEGLPEEFRHFLKQSEIKVIPVPEQAIFEHGCNLQALGKHRVISLAKNKAVNEELAKNGMEVITLDITEILKAGGGPHCMTFPLVRE
ncbi:MAG: dimethylarginine dimethylaminohydrolase family protein [Lachnospiraceae bacterium]